MTSINYTNTQEKVIQSATNSTIFFEGPAGSGKTTAALARLERMLTEIPGHQIMVLVPQRSLGIPYQEFLRSASNYRGSQPAILTLGGLSRRMINLFWPLVSAQAGFKQPTQPPAFLSLETAQYCMAEIVDPKREKGFFDAVTIDKNRIYSQVIDNLNKAAVVRFPIDEIAARLKSDQNLDPGILPALEHAQVCALEFRQYCLDNNLLDFSLQVEIFLKHIWPLEICKHYFQAYYPHVICDNLEEDVPATHDLVKEWLPKSQSALMITDSQGGYRTFLGADPKSALTLKPLCKLHFAAAENFNSDKKMLEFRSALDACIQHEPAPQPIKDFNPVLDIQDFRFYPQMLSGVADKVAEMINEQGKQADEIVILAPYLSDALKFSLTRLLDQHQIPSYASRPSRMYIEEPAVKCLLTFAKLAHPQWDIPVSHYDLRDALLQVLPNLDIIRADLIAQTLFTQSKSSAGLRSFDSISSAKMQERITFTIGEKIEKIRQNIKEYQAGESQPLDIFLSRFFGELLSQKDFGLFNNMEAAESIAQLIYAVKTFRQFLGNVFSRDDISSGIEFIKTIEEGLLPSIFLPKQQNHADAVLIAPAHTFLMENRSAACQFWLDIGSLGWWERLNQPLTNAYILRRDWQPGDLWTHPLDYDANQEQMQRVISGLMNRCREKVYVYSVQVNERGSEQRGPLLQAFQILRKRAFAAREADHV